MMLLERVMSWDQKKRGLFARAARETMNLTRRELARKIGTSPARLGRIERGLADLWLSEFFELCLLIGWAGIRSNQRPKIRKTKH